MATYTQFLGRNVCVQYRAGDVLLSASGSFVGDSGRSIFLEQHLEQRGKRNYFRWEIPYQCIHRIELETEPGEDSRPGPEVAGENTGKKAASASAGQSALSAPSVLPLPQRPKTA